METNNAYRYRSEEIDKIMAALSVAQGSYKALVANQVGPNGPFANLRAILEAVKESLSKNGLGFYQFIELLDEGAGFCLLRTVLGHESGQYISSSARFVIGKNERQTGNLLGIYKRRHAEMLLGIAPLDNDPITFDDDGEIIAEETLIADLRKPDTPKNIPIDRNDTVNKTQYEELLIELTGFDKLAKDIMETYDIQTLADLPASEYHKARSRILKIKRTHEDYLRKK